MFRSLWNALSAEVSGSAAAQAVADIARFHRIQASPGYRRAAQWVHERLAEAGLRVRILTYPANATASFWGMPGFQEWDARAGTLHLVEPADQARRLADYRDLPLNLIARSLPFDGQAELVVLDKGTDAAEYAGLDLRGKVALVRGNVRHAHDLAIRRHGAAGLVYDGMTEVEPVRPAWSLLDAVQYTSFWWQNQEPCGFGFAITPRQGEQLRRLAREHTLHVRAHVDARLYDGTFEVVEATIPGRIDQEIVLVAHLCHPRPSANDNASGAAALLEAARALHTLIERGELDPPRRTLRFLWVPEMTGSLAYLADHEPRIPHMVAGLNLDMVGQDQEQCGSSLLFEQPPGAAANFTPAILDRLREQFLPQAKTFGGVGGYPLFRTADVPFGGGSDHYIFADPSAGVPMPMVIQWPDRFYHTSDDTPDRVDPAMLGRVGCLAAAYGHWLAQAGAPEARWLVRELSSRFRRDALARVQDAVTHADDRDGSSQTELRAQIAYQVDRHRDTLESVRRLAQVDVSATHAGDAAFALHEMTDAVDLLPDRPTPAAPEVDGAELVPRRRVRGPAQPSAYTVQLDAAGRDRATALGEQIDKASYVLPILAEYWADGRRSVAEIAGLVRQETGLEATELLVDYFRLLADLDLVDLE